MLTILKGSSVNPHQSPLIIILVRLYIWLGAHSCRKDIFNFLNIGISLYFEYPSVISADIDKCLCNPTLPPSGVSTGSIIPHCEPCSNLGPITFALESNGKFTFLSWDMKELNERRLRSCTRPSFFVCSVAPQFPLNAFLNPFSSILSLKYSW